MVLQFLRDLHMIILKARYRMLLSLTWMCGSKCCIYEPYHRAETFDRKGSFICIRSRTSVFLKQPFENMSNRTPVIGIQVWKFIDLLFAAVSWGIINTLFVYQYRALGAFYEKITNVFCSFSSSGSICRPVQVIAFHCFRNDRGRSI